MLYRPEDVEVSGIFGGTFNPPHIGHLILAEEAIRKLNLKDIIFVPSGKPPHKSDGDAESETRLRLVTLATFSNDSFKVSDYEIKKEAVSYTIETLKYFSSKFKGNIVFLMGMDSLQDIKNWKNYEEILDAFMIAVFRRPGAKESEIQTEIKEKVTIIEAPEIPVSSSEIRRRIKSAEPFRYLVTEKVYSYIDSMDLYK